MAAPNLSVVAPPEEDCAECFLRDHVKCDGFLLSRRDKRGNWIQKTSEHQTRAEWLKAPKIPCACHARNHEPKKPNFQRRSTP
jgi:hypothetical protein